MPPTMHRVNERRDRAPSHTRWRWLAVLVVVAACGTDTADPTDARAPCTPPATGSAPTYTELYTKYFAPKTPGHCATKDCHLSEADSTGWVCGTTKDSCYQGMVSIGIIDPMFPRASVIADPKNSPLRWINPNGPMPQDAVKAFPEGADAIMKWVATCAQNN
jgi:hypothetical protein